MNKLKMLIKEPPPSRKLQTTHWLHQTMNKPDTLIKELPPIRKLQTASKPPLPAFYFK
jgi:hypothetical protein